MNIIILQARENGTRLPNKVLLEVCGKTLLEHFCDRQYRNELWTNGKGDI